MSRRPFAALLAFACALSLGWLSAASQAAEGVLTLVSTTSIDQSGLFTHLLPAFTQATGIQVRVVAVGAGQALDIGRRGDADVLLVHDKAAEEKFIDEGWGLPRRDVMYGDFVLVGPKDDPAGVKGNDIVAAFAKLWASSSRFLSRGDRSGTYAAELRYWKAADIDSPGQKMSGYRECGCGMGPALNMASSTHSYLLADRGAWLSFSNRGDLTILVEGDKRLFEQYGVIVVNPARQPQTRTTLAQAFSDWIVSSQGQATIASYRLGGEQLFFPDAKP